MIYETFSKRQKAAQGGYQEFYIYNEIPKTLRTQIVYIWYDTLGGEDAYLSTAGENVRTAYHFLVENVRKEVGVFILPPSNKHMRITYLEEIVDYFLNESDINKVLDVIEMSFNLINELVRKYRYQFKQESNDLADQAIKDLNIRFKEHNIGYRFESPRLIRIDSEFIHSESVKPALKLLTKPEYTGAQEEFSTAFDHYKHGRKKEVLDACLKAFESLMKSICKKRGWTYNSNATASPLIKICLQNKLIPSFQQSKLESFQSLLESGIPIVSNKLSRHGQGSEVIGIPDSLVNYALHETAVILVLLDQAEAELK